jgi:hypothetical protein
LLGCSIFADIVALESLQPQGVYDNLYNDDLSLVSARARLAAPSLIESFDKVKKAFSTSNFE